MLFPELFKFGGIHINQVCKNKGCQWHRDDFNAFCVSVVENKIQDTEDKGQYAYNQEELVQSGLVASIEPWKFTLRCVVHCCSVSVA